MVSTQRTHTEEICWWRCSKVRVLVKMKTHHKDQKDDTSLSFVGAECFFQPTWSLTWPRQPEQQWEQLKPSKIQTLQVVIIKSKHLGFQTCPKNLSFWLSFNWFHGCWSTDPQIFIQIQNKPDDRKNILSEDEDKKLWFVFSGMNNQQWTSSSQWRSLKPMQKG